MLWINWRSLRFDPLLRTAPVTLVGTLKPTVPNRLRGWQFLVGMIFILIARPFVYWGIGGPVGWTARLDLGVVALPFRADLMEPMVAFSLVSFLRVALVFYFWLIVLAALNRSAEADPIARIIRLHLGKVGTWPSWVQVPLSVVAAILGWLALQPLLSHAQVTAGYVPIGRLAMQGLLIATGLVLSLKYLLPLFLLAHLVYTYVYLGSNPLWDFISTTAHNLLRPLNWLPLRGGKLDLAPLIGAVLIFLLLHWLPLALANELARRRISLWPE